MSTLSVEISTTVSPSLTVSPTLTDHSRIVPSVTDSPPVGVTMSIVARALASVGATASRLGLGGRGLGGLVAAPAAAGLGGAGRRRPSPGSRRVAAVPPLPSVPVAISASSAPTATVSPSRGVDLARSSRRPARAPRRRPCRWRSRRASRRRRSCRPPACATRAPCPRRPSRPWPASQPGSCSRRLPFRFNCNACESAQMRPAPPPCAALATTKADRAGKRPQATEHGHRHREPERDDPHPGGGDADQRHRDPQQPVSEPQDERLGLRVAGDEGAHQQRQVHGRVGERRDLQPAEA